MGKTIKVIARTACLGGAVINLFTNVNIMLHCQKNRVDYILDISEDPSKKAQADKILPLICVDFIKYTINEQECDIFSIKNPDAFLMDSFSELADKRFRHKNEGFEFCACMQDVNRNCEEFLNNYEIVGEIPLTEVESNYRKLFAKIVSVYGNIPIIFMHFSYKFETREDYIKRAITIINAIENLQKEFPNLYSIKLPDNMVFEPEDKCLYHYSRKTYKNYAKQITKLHLCFKEKNKCLNALKSAISMLFSVKNETNCNKKHKVITILGMKIKWRKYEKI